MNIDIIKKELEKNIDKKLIIKYNMGRNKIEKYNARIKNLYNSIFTVELDDTKTLKSFMYTDVITKTIKIDYK